MYSIFLSTVVPAYLHMLIKIHIFSCISINATALLYLCVLTDLQLFILVYSKLYDHISIVYLDT
jgi:hypothetical protein